LNFGFIFFSQLVRAELCKPGLGMSGECRKTEASKIFSYIQCFGGR